jgi:hypothetical protein
MFSYVQNDVKNCLKGMYLALAYACMNLCQMANPAKQGLKLDSTFPSMGGNVNSARKEAKKHN